MPNPFVRTLVPWLSRLSSNRVTIASVHANPEPFAPKLKCSWYITSREYMTQSVVSASHIRWVLMTGSSMASGHFIRSLLILVHKTPLLQFREEIWPYLLGRSHLNTRSWEVKLEHVFRYVGSWDYRITFRFTDDNDNRPSATFFVFLLSGNPQSRQRWCDLDNTRKSYHKWSGQGWLRQCLT